MRELTRKQTSIIFKARTRMTKVKNNYRNGQTNIKCRACKTEDETQDHVLKECTELHPNETTKIKYEDIFSECTDTLRKIANQINETMTKLENY